MVYKTALDYSKENNHQEIVELLMKGVNQATDSGKAAKLTSPKKEEKLDKETENDQLREKVSQLESKNHHLEVKIQQLIEENRLMKEKSCTTDEVARLNSYLSALKEKVKKIEFVNSGDYEEGSEIGGGGTSSVKVVFKKEKYAKKELKEFDFKTLKRFLAEADILFTLRHPCIVRIHGVNYGDEQHRPSIYLSLEPQSLEKAIKDKVLSGEQKSRIAVEIVLGMRYIHSRGFMHRDLKPLNILLSKNLHVRISDFGLAKEEDPSVSQTKGIGTSRFMAPELFEENDDEVPYTNKVDVYSFGITMIFIINDAYPKFSLRNALNGVLPPLPETIVQWVRDLIAKCLSVSAEERPSFAEIFEIMKSNNYDLFHSESSKLTSKQKQMKKEIEQRILKIEAFEYQHRDD